MYLEPRLKGFLYADGWATYNKAGQYYEVGFQQSISKSSIYKYYRDKLLSIHKGYYRERLRNNKLEIKIYSKKIYTILVDVKRNPIKYFYENPIEFLAGLTDGDGSIMDTEIAIYDCNKALLNTICTFLKENMIRCRVNPCRSIWRIRIRGRESIEKFLTLIPVITRKITHVPRVKPRRLNRGGPCRGPEYHGLDLPWEAGSHRLPRLNTSRDR